METAAALVNGIIDNAPFHFTYQSDVASDQPHPVL